MVARAFTVAGTHSSMPTVRKMTAGTSGTETGLHVGSYGSVSNKMIGVYELVRISHDSATSKTTIRYKEDANKPSANLNRYTFSDLIITNIGGTSYSQTFNFQDDNSLDSVTESSNEIIFVFNVNTAFVNTNEYRVEFIQRKGIGDCFVQPAKLNPGDTDYRLLNSARFGGFCVPYNVGFPLFDVVKLGNITGGGEDIYSPRITVTGEPYPRNLLRTQLPIEANHYGYLIKAILFMKHTSNSSNDRVVLCLDTNGDYTHDRGVSEIQGFDSMTIGSTTYNQSDRIKAPEFGRFNANSYYDSLPGDFLIEWNGSGGDPFGGVDGNNDYTTASVRVTFD